MNAPGEQGQKYPVQVQFVLIFQKIPYEYSRKPDPEQPGAKKCQRPDKLITG